MIRVEGLRKQFGSVTAVDDVSFVAPDGAVTGLLGPNGAGKTTTLRMLYALMRPDAGRIHIDDIDAVADPQRAQARLGVLPDVSGLYPRLTPREHIHYYGELQGVSGTALRSRTDELLQLLDMAGIADRRTAGFSHGERTKVALARALVHNPRNVLLDEPTNGLDVMSTRAVREIVRRLRGEGRTRGVLQPRHAGGLGPLRQHHRHRSRAHRRFRQPGCAAQHGPGTRTSRMPS